MRATWTWARRLVVEVAIAFGLSAAVPAGTVPEGGEFPVSWLWSWVPQSPAWSARGLPERPVQQRGSATSDGHHVSADATRARRGSGSPQQSVQTTTTNTAQQVDARFPANNAGASEIVAGSSWIDEPQWRVPSGKLHWNETYLYTVRVHDNEDVSELAPAYVFTTAVPQRHVASQLAKSTAQGFDPATGNYSIKDSCLMKCAEPGNYYEPRSTGETIRRGRAPTSGCVVQ